MLTVALEEDRGLVYDPAAVGRSGVSAGCATAILGRGRGERAAERDGEEGEGRE